MPWALTQQQPLDTARFIGEAEKRGFGLDLATLRELYRLRLLIPFIEITGRPVRPPAKPDVPESPFGSTRLQELQEARNTGRIRDLATEPFKPHVAFKQPQGWWSGLLYSHYQLLVLPTVQGIQLTNVPKVEDWEAYRAAFNPVEMETRLQYSAKQARDDAEWLLVRANFIDPVGSEWSRLMRRAPIKSRKYLKDAALLALDARIAAEILLRFYEDLAHRGQAEPLPDLPGPTAGRAWHPLAERLSYHPDRLDDDLVRLGISPHPRVILAIEGEAEAVHAPLIMEALGYSDAPELLRLLKLSGVNQDVRKVAALNTAPLISGKVPASNEWRLTKPYSRLIIAVDPESDYGTPEKVENERAKILDEIKDVLKVQGVEHPNPEELDELVDIRVWDESCYEFEHFTDDELADGIMRIHRTIAGWTRDQLVEALGYWRGRKQDIKYVWASGRWDAATQRVTGRWEFQPSKVELAKTLWPVLEEKIEQNKTAAGTVPLLVQIIAQAYQLAQQWRYVSFVLAEVPDNGGAQQGGSGEVPQV
jgi:antitoxin component HigA of HigAB toxin-antitoxin module